MVRMPVSGGCCCLFRQRQSPPPPSRRRRPRWKLWSAIAIVLVVAAVVVDRISVVWENSMSSDGNDDDDDNGGNNGTSTTTRSIWRLHTGGGLGIGGGGEYLYWNDQTHANARAVIEVTEATGFFQTSLRNRVVKFYSPYCGHCVHFKKSFMSVAAAARLKYPPSTTFANTELEFYAVSCVAWPDLCNAYHIEAYPSVYAYPANAAATNESKIDVGSMFFSLTKVERALQLSASSSSASIFPTDTISTSTTPQSNQRQLQDTDDRGGTDDKDSKKPNNDNTNGQRPNDDNEKGPKEEDDRADDNDQEKGDNNKEEEEAEDFEFHRARTNHAAIPMRAGAAFAKSKPRTMDQWKEEQQKVLVKRQQDDGENPSQRRWARKTPRMRQKQKLLQQQQQHEWDKARSRDPDGATPIMLAHRNGTLEFKTRESDRLAALKRMKQSRRPRRQRDSKTVATGVVSVSTNTTISFQKKISSPGFAEHLPLVKRMVQQQMTTEEELILDASLSFLEGLRVGLQRKQRPLDWGQTQTLRDWLQLMRISLPPEWALLGTIDALIGSLDQISQNVKAINKILKKFKVPRKEWSKSCSPEHGFSCGFWKLLHVMTVGMAEHRGGQDLIDSGIFKPSTRVFSPDEAARTLRQYMLHFFPCDACAQHFVAMYDQCDKHRRCDRLTTATTTASDADWKELAKWLWEVHNSVSVNVLNEKIDTKRKKKQRSLIKKAPAGPGVASREEQIEVLWPAVDDCMECFKQDGSYDENAVFVHLEATYWPGHDLKDTPRRLIWFQDDSESALRLNSILFAMAILIVVLMRNRIKRASVAQTMLLKVKALKARAAGGKIRTF